jgi:hypothetical protein
MFRLMILFASHLTMGTQLSGEGHTQSDGSDLTASLVVGLLIWEGLHFRDNYLEGLKFPKSLCNGETNEGEGKKIVWYHVCIDTTGVDWWHITWVFYTRPSNKLSLLLRLYE